MTSFGGLEALTESVRDSQLPVTFRWEGQRQLTIHTQGASRRAKQNQEVWVHMGTLGHGGFGTVELQAKEPTSNRPGAKQFRAVKSIRVTEEELRNNSEFYARELEAIVKFSQARYGELFVKSFGWFTSDSSLHIAMEYCELGDLQKFLLKNGKNRRLPEDQTHDIASQVLDALASMHEERFVHRDLKPANILIKSHPPAHPWAVKVADFGISRRDQDGTTTVRGTSTFMPPELLGISSQNARAVDLFAVDMWCYGETLYRILTGDAAFQSLADLFAYYHGSIQFPASSLEDLAVSDHVVDFLRSLLACNPVGRLTVATALDHAWMEAGSSSPNTASHTTYSSNGKDGTHVFPVHAIPSQPEWQTGESEASASWTDNFSQLTVHGGRGSSHLPVREQSNNGPESKSTPITANVPQHEISEGIVANAKRRLETVEHNLANPNTSFKYSSTSGEPTPFIMNAKQSSGDQPVSVSPDPPKKKNEPHTQRPNASLSWQASGRARDAVRHRKPSPPLNPPPHRDTQTQNRKPLPSGKPSIENVSGAAPRPKLNVSEVGQDSLDWNMPHKNHPNHGKLVRDDDLKVLSIQGDKALESLKKKDFNTARDLYERHWDILRDRLGEEHPRTILALANLVKTLERLKRYGEMELFCRKLVDARSKAMGPDDRMTFHSWRILARCVMYQGRLSESVAMFNTVIESCVRLGDHDAHFKTLESLVYVYLEKGRLTEAETKFTELIKLKGDVLGANHELVLDSIYRYSVALKASSHRDLALPIARQFISLAESMEATGQPLTANTRKQLEDLSWAKSPAVQNSAKASATSTSRGVYGGNPSAGKFTFTPATTPAARYSPPKKSKSSRLRDLFS